MFTALSRHARGDWGDLLPEDAVANELALKQGGRLFSAYGQGQERFWVITAADRSLTTGAPAGGLTCRSPGTAPPSAVLWRFVTGPPPVATPRRPHGFSRSGCRFARHASFSLPPIMAATSGGLTRANLRPQPPAATRQTAFTNICFFQSVNLRFLTLQRARAARCVPWA